MTRHILHYDIPNTLVYSKLEMAKEMEAFELWLGLRQEYIHFEDLSVEHRNALINLAANFCQTQAGKYAMAVLNENEETKFYTPAFYGIVGGLLRSKKYSLDNNDAVPSFAMSPNPSAEYVQIQVQGPNLESTKSIEICNSNGQKIKSLNFEIGQKFLLLNTSDLPIGAYVVTLLVDDGRIESQQLFIQH
jgi:Secretion system C-terminal sorting domain